MTERDPANTPAISDTGEVCFVRSSPARVELHTDRRGLVLDLGDSIGTTCDINSRGDIVYRGVDGEGTFQIFSTVGQQLTDEDGVLLGSPSVNNNGQVVWVQSGELFSLQEGQVTEFGGLVGFRADLNDRGDVVLPYRQKKSFMVVLATRYPEMYPDFRPLKYQSVRRPEFEVAMLVDPAGNPGMVDLNAGDLLHVAILTTHLSKGEAQDFDALQVDALSVRFGPDRADIVVRSMSAQQDVDADGDTDLLLFFRPNRPGFGCGDTDATLEGRTKDGKAFHGFAPILTSGCE